MDNLPDSRQVFLKESATVNGAVDPRLFELIKRKGLFPYEWFDSFDKLAETSLPARHEWSSRLKRAFLSKKEFLKLQETWDAFGMKTFKDWHDFYLSIDVDGLTDVFEEFRRMCLETYKLDPLHYFTAPGLFNDALYKLTGQRVELFSDIDMYNFCEKGIRGGLSVQTHRYAKANHEYLGLDSFDPQPN